MTKDNRTAKEVEDKMKELFTKEQLKRIDKLAEQVFGKPSSLKFPSKQ